MPPHQRGVGGGVPPKGRLPHPPHLGLLKQKPRGGPNLTPPPSLHFGAAPTVNRHPHGRRGWVGYGGQWNHPPPWPELNPWLVRDQELEPQRFQREHCQLQGLEPPQPVHCGGSDHRHQERCLLMALAQAEPHSARYAL